MTDGGARAVFESLDRVADDHIHRSVRCAVSSLKKVTSSDVDRSSS